MDMLEKSHEGASSIVPHCLPFNIYTATHMTKVFVERTAAGCTVMSPVFMYFVTYL